MVFKKKTKLKCDDCGEEMETHSLHTTKNNKNVFYCENCAGKYLKGGVEEVAPITEPGTPIQPVAAPIAAPVAPVAPIAPVSPGEEQPQKLQIVTENQLLNFRLDKIEEQLLEIIKRLRI